MHRPVLTLAGVAGKGAKDSEGRAGESDFLTTLLSHSHCLVVPGLREVTHTMDITERAARAAKHGKYSLTGVQSSPCG